MPDPPRPAATTISDLPPELVERCIQECSTLTLVSACRTARILHFAAMRALYRDVSLNSVGALIVCCRTLAARPAASSAVRSLSIHYPSATVYLQNLYDLIARAFRAIPELWSLRLLAPDPRLLYVLERTTLPGLTQFQCQLTLSAPLAKFLNRHLGLTSVDLSPYENTQLFQEQPSLPTLQLPGLQYFVGNAQGVERLGEVAVGRLRAVSVSWDAMDRYPQRAIGVLGRGASAEGDLRVLRCRRRGWNLDLVDLVSAVLPGLYELTIANVLVVDSRPTKEYLQTMETYLSRFKHLRRIAVHCVDTWRMGDIQCNMDEDFQTVTAWGKACPSLKQIILPHSSMMAWHRATADIWIPDPRNHCGAVWLYESVMAHRFPAWTQLVGFIRSSVTRISQGSYGQVYLDHREHVAALEETLRVLEDLVHASVASIVTSTHPTTGEPRQMRWAIRPDAIPSVGAPVEAPTPEAESARPVPSPQRLKASLREWKKGRGHKAFLELYSTVITEDVYEL